MGGVRCGPSASCALLVQEARDSVVQNCETSGSVQSGGPYVGGVAASVVGGSFINNINRANVASAESEVGGLVGVVSGAQFAKAGNFGTVSGSNAVGGVVGSITGDKLDDLFNQGEVSHNSGPVMGEVSIGGIVGEKIGFSSWDVFRCYNIGIVSGPVGGGSTGRIYGGADQPPDSSNCLFATDVSCLNCVNRPGEEFGKTLAELKQSTSYLSYGFDFTNIWVLETNSFPNFR